MYELKANAPAFEQISGPMAGRKFEHGKQYPEVPEDMKGRFKKIKTAAKKKAAPTEEVKNAE